MSAPEADSAIGRTLHRMVEGWPPDCNADHPTTGQACEFETGHRGLHLAGGNSWSTRGEELAAITLDLDTTTVAWARAGHPFSGPEYDAREAVFARLRTWNDGDADAYRVVGAATTAAPAVQPDIAAGA